MTRYRFLLNDADILGLPVESARLSLRAGGPDSLELRYQADESGTPPHAYGDIVTIKVETLDQHGTVTATETLFSGRVKPRRTSGNATDAGFSYQVVNGWDDMRITPLTQTRSSWNPTTESVDSVAVTRVMLGQDATGALQDTGATLTEIITAAAAAGCRVTAGTIDPALTVPSTEVVDTSCDQALRQILQYHPDHVAYLSDQTLNVLAPASLTAVAVDPSTDALRVETMLREDKTPPGVVLIYEITHNNDGNTYIERQVQSAGVTTGFPPPVRMTIPLAGSKVTYLKQEIRTRTLPTGDVNNATKKNFWRAFIPQIADAADGELSITDTAIAFANPGEDGINEDGDAVTNPNSKPFSTGSDEIGDFPRQLIFGKIEPWMPGNLKQYDAILSATLTYSGSDPEISEYVGDGLQISEPITVTNALPKIYREIDSVDQGETPISGLAQSYWDAIKTAANEGSISGNLQGKYIGLKPGAKVTLSGYFETAAVVSEFSANLITQDFTTRFGGSEFLNPKTLTDLARTLAQNKPTWQNPEERTEAKAELGNKPINPAGDNVIRYAHPARPVTSSSLPWSLTSATTEAGTVYTVVQGTILQDIDDVETVVTITDNASPFSPTAGDILYLEITDENPTTATLEIGSTWTGHPSAYETSGTGATHAFAAYRFPLWAWFAASANDGRIAIGENLYALRLASNHYRVVNAAYKETGEPVLTVPALIPSHRAIPTV